jgi:hypothetical protein
MLPHDQLGRANAAILACTFSLMLAAALAAGALGTLFGTRGALVIGPAVGLVAPLVLLAVRSLRSVPHAPEVP